MTTTERDREREKRQGTVWAQQQTFYTMYKVPIISVVLSVHHTVIDAFNMYLMCRCGWVREQDSHLQCWCRVCEHSRLVSLWMFRRLYWWRIYLLRSIIHHSSVCSIFCFIHTNILPSYIIHCCLDVLQIWTSVLKMWICVKMASVSMFPAAIAVNVRWASHTLRTARPVEVRLSTHTDCNNIIYWLTVI